MRPGWPISLLSAVLSVHRRILALLVGCVVIHSPAAALDVAVVLSDKGGVHALFADALRTNLAVTGHRLIDGGNLDEGVDDASIARADLILTSGVAATEAMVQRSRTPMLAVLVSHGQYLRLRGQYPHATLSAIVLDQPPGRQLALLLAVLPDIRRFGVLFGPDTIEQEAGFRAAASRVGLELVDKQLSTAAELMPALQQTLESTDALLAIADPLLTSSAAARAVLLSSYRYRRPVFAYSRAYVDAGALAAVFSSPGNVARDVVEWLRELRGDELQQPQVRAPRHFDVAINAQVARALNLDVEDAAKLLARVREEDRP